MFLFCISNLFLMGQKIQELNTLQSNSDEEIYLYIRKVSYGILNITISVAYLKYPTFIEPLGHIEVRHGVFQDCILREFSFLLKRFLFTLLHSTPQENLGKRVRDMWLRYTSHPVKYIQGVCYCKDFGLNYQPGIIKIEVLGPQIKSCIKRMYINHSYSDVIIQHQPSNK